MSSNGTNEKNGNGNYELVLRDLESLLRKSMGNELIVVDYDTTYLIPKGENYGSTLLKLNAVIKRSKAAPEEELYLVAKMMAGSDYMRKNIDTTGSFLKEIFVFEKLFSAYRKLQKEAGVKDENLIQILPKFYAGRLTRNAATPNVADEDAVILLENLKEQGYYTLNRKYGLDLSHAKLAIKELARFHALGLALKQKQPEFIENHKELLNTFVFIGKNSEFEDVNKKIIETINEDLELADYKERVNANLAKNTWDTYKVVVNVEPWVSIAHGDFWVNNVMFHQSNGKVDGVKFIDFQITRISSPLRDLPYFMCTSLALDVIENNFDELLNIYYEQFVETLRETACDVTPFTRKSFDEQLKRDGNLELYHCLLATKVFTMEVTQDTDMNNMKSTILLGEVNTLFLNRCRSIVNKFVEKEWI